MLNLSIRMYLEFFRQRTGNFFLISTGIFVTVLGTIFIFSRGIFAYEETCADYMETRTVTFTINDEIQPAARQKLYDLFCKNTEDIFQIMVIDRKSEMIGYFADKNKNFSIPYGRYFSEEEKNGAHVILLSDAYLSSQSIANPETMLQQSVKIEGDEEEYKIIGRYNGTIIGSSIRSMETVIPLKTYLNHTFPISVIEIIFNKNADKAFAQNIENFLEEEKISFQFQPPFRIEKEAVLVFLQETFSHFLILGVCALTLLQLLKHWIRTNKKRLQVYYMCGCPAKKLFALVLLCTIHICIMPVLLSVVVYKCMEGYFYQIQFTAELNFGKCLAVGLFIIVCAVVLMSFCTKKYLKNIVCQKQEKKNERIISGS